MFDPKENESPDLFEIGLRAHANRDLLRQAPAAIGTAVQMLRRDLYDCAARVVGEDDHDLSKLYEGQAGGEK